MARSYDMTRRAQEAARTSERILDATEALLHQQEMGAITLQGVAQGAEVTVQTVLRHMGSREGLIAALAERVRARIDGHRRPVADGDREAAIEALMEHYELDGALVLKLLSQEGTDELARRCVVEGRASHRLWVRRYLLADQPEVAEAVVDAAVAATDLYVWKLLRLDLGRSRAQTAAVIHRLLGAAKESA